MLRFHLAGVCLAGAVSLPALRSQPERPDYPVQPVPFTSVHLDDVFWAPRIETNRQVTIPVAFQQCERTNRVYHVERAAKALRGEPLEDRKPPGYPFDDSDLYKVTDVERLSRSEARGIRGRPHREDRGPIARVPPFSPVTTQALRIEPAMQPQFSAGLQEWRVK